MSEPTIRLRRRRGSRFVFFFVLFFFFNEHPSHKLTNSSSFFCLLLPELGVCLLSIYLFDRLSLVLPCRSTHLLACPGYLRAYLPTCHIPFSPSVSVCSSSTLCLHGQAACSFFIFRHPQKEEISLGLLFFSIALVVFLLFFLYFILLLILSVSQTIPHRSLALFLSHPPSRFSFAHSETESALSHSLIHSHFSRCSLSVSPLGRILACFPLSVFLLCVCVSIALSRLCVLYQCLWSLSLSLARILSHFVSRHYTVISNTLSSAPSID